VICVEKLQPVNAGGHIRAGFFEELIVAMLVGDAPGNEIHHFYKPPMAHLEFAFRAERDNEPHKTVGWTVEMLGLTFLVFIGKARFLDSIVKHLFLIDPDVAHKIWGFGFKDQLLWDSHSSYVAG
jgi:hypothetical protein